MQICTQKCNLKIEMQLEMHPALLKFGFPGASKKKLSGSFQGDVMAHVGSALKP